MGGDGGAFAGASAGAGTGAGAGLVELARMAIKAGRSRSHPASRFQRQYLCLRSYQRCSV